MVFRSFRTSGDTDERLKTAPPAEPSEPLFGAAKSAPWVRNFPLDADLADRLLNDQRLLDIPLVRVDNGFAAGRNEPAWKSLVASR